MAKYTLDYESGARSIPKIVLLFPCFFFRGLVGAAGLQDSANITQNKKKKKTGPYAIYWNTVRTGNAFRVLCKCKLHLRGHGWDL